LSEQIASYLRNKGSQCIFSCYNKFTSIIRLGKDNINIFNKNYVVYKISSKNCTVDYIGQAVRSLDAQKKEHESSINKQDEKSVIYRHCSENFYEFDFENESVLDVKKNKLEREFSELLNIHLFSKNINKKQTFNFYLTLIRKE